ncbi:MAG: hypothetical protein AB1646_24885 [Thermodesulfobacteriota bacterium]
MSRWLQTWEFLKRIVDRKDFQPSPLCAQRMRATLDEAVKSLADTIYEGHREALNVQSLQEILVGYQIKATGNNPRSLLRRALPSVVEKGLEQDLCKKLDGLLRADHSDQRPRPAEKLLQKEGEQHYARFQGKEAARKFSKEWLMQVCGDLGIQPAAGRRDVLFKDALRKIYRAHKEDLFWEAVSQADSTPGQDTKHDLSELEHFYLSVSGVSTDKARQRLDQRFPENENFVPDFKRFLKEFGISQKQYKRETWLKKVAEHLATLRRVEAKIRQ